VKAGDPLTLDVPAQAATRWPMAADLAVKRLGECRHASPLAHEPFVDDARRVLLCSDAAELGAGATSPPSFEPAGPRRRIFFEPQGLTCGILTCGGLCPGLNNVVRAIVLRLAYGYQVRRIYGLAIPSGTSRACSSRTSSSTSTSGAGRCSARRRMRIRSVDRVGSALEPQHDLCRRLPDRRRLRVERLDRAPVHLD